MRLVVCSLLEECFSRYRARSAAASSSSMVLPSCVNIAAPRTHRDRRLLAVVVQFIGNALRDLQSRYGLRFQEDEHEFVPSISGRRINRAAMILENICEPAKRAASHKMTMGVIDLLQSVQIKQQHRKGSPGASVPLDFRVE